MARAKSCSRSRSRRRKGRCTSDSSSRSRSREPVPKKAKNSKRTQRSSKGRRRRNASASSSASGPRRPKLKAKAPPAKEAKNKSDKQSKAAAKEARPAENEATAVPPAEEVKADAGAKKASLGDLAELQKQLELERGVLEVQVLKAKREAEEKKESQDKREKREMEYYKASYGDPVGPSNRFLVEEELGKGAFSTVFRCRDTQAGGKEYAVKFVRANQMLRKATEKEVKLMRRLRTQASEQDPEGAQNFLALTGAEMFEHEGHLALVFPLLRCDLRSGLLKYGQGRGLPLLTVRGFARNIFLALRALRRIDVIHSDLKPDNLLMTLDKAAVKLSDFGSAMDMASRIRTDFVQPRFYRSPEVILGQSYGPPIDVWSAGATLYELASGKFLFTGATNNAMILDMLKVCGAFPKKVSTVGEFAMRHFTQEGDFRQEATPPASAETNQPMSSFPKEQSAGQFVLQLLEAALMQPPTGLDPAMHKGMIHALADLIGRCLDPQMGERILPEQALDHRFLQKGALQGGTTK